jgi:hypothetical protein
MERLYSACSPPGWEVATTSTHAAKWYGILASIPLIPTRQEAVSPGGHQLEEQPWQCRIGRGHLIGKRHMAMNTYGS